MNAANSEKSRNTIENVLIMVVLWGGAWMLGFLLGFG